MAKVALADVLWDAANVHLATTYWMSDSGKEQFTCHALAWAVYGPVWGDMKSHPAFVFIQSLGCDPVVSGFDAEAYEDEKAMQGDRYMWLLLAMHVAEDEGLTVEVSQ